MNLHRKTYMKIIKLLLLPFYFICLFITVDTAVSTFRGESPWYVVLIFAAGMAALTRAVRNLWIPRYTRPMKVMKRLLHYSEMKQALAQEEFQKLWMSGENRYGTPAIWLSKNWICVDGVMIPKKMCLGIQRYATDIVIDYEQFFIITVKGDCIVIGKMERQYVPGFLKVLKEEIPGLITDMVFSGSADLQKNLKQEFEARCENGFHLSDWC